MVICPLHKAVMLDLQGPLMNAICALSNLHYIGLQRTTTFDPPAGPYPDDSVAQFFYNQACFQLKDARRRPHYTETDAMAALHLISYSLAGTGGKTVGGVTEWSPMLEIACDWLAQTGMHVEENPKMTLVNMNVLGAYAARSTMVSVLEEVM